MREKGRMYAKKDTVLFYHFFRLSAIIFLKMHDFLKIKA